MLCADNQRCHRASCRREEIIFRRWDYRPCGYSHAALSDNLPMTAFVRTDAADLVGVFQLTEVLLHAGNGKTRGISNLRHCNIRHRFYNRKDFLATFLVTFLATFLVGSLICLTLSIESSNNFSCIKLINDPLWRISKHLFIHFSLLSILIIYIIVIIRG